MSITLEEASKLSNDVLLIGVIETIIKESPILQELPFIQIVGNGLTYNQENTLPTVGWYHVGEEWQESAPTFTKVTAELKVVGGDADVDNFLKATRSNLQDLEAAVIELKAKALRHEFEKVFLNGDHTADADQFDGLHTLLAGTDQEVTSGTNGATLSFASLDKLIDKVLGGKPDMLLMSRRSRRKLQSLVRASGTMLETRPGKYLEQIQMYNGIPIAISDWVKDDYVVGSSSVCSAIFAFQMGEGAACGLSSPEMLQVERIGSLETKDASRTRVKWYVSLALFSSVKAAVLTGVTD